MIILVVFIFFMGIIAAWIFLPTERSATVRYDFDAPIEEVWAVFHDPQNQPNWRINIARVEMHETSFPRCWTEFVRYGPPITLTELEISPPHRMVLSTQAHNIFDGRYEAVFEQVDEGKTIGVMNEQVSLTGFIPRLLSALFVRPEKLIVIYAQEAMEEIHKRQKGDT